MQNISTILLDMYGVIIEESKGNFIPYTYEHFNEKEYERLIGKKPSECIFVDNSVANLNVSNELGICPILFNRDNVEYAGITVNTFGELAGILNSSYLLGSKIK